MIAERIERREYKYLIDERTARAIRASLAPFCELDPFAAARPGGSYAIQSFYFDSPDFVLYHANERELGDRYKIRVRHYPGAGCEVVSLEVKRRINDVVSKTRALVPIERWTQLLSSPDDPRRELGGNGAHLAAVERFVSLIHTHHAHPVAVVEYEREPWASRIDDYARVTFDRRVRCQTASALSLQTDPRRWRCVDHALVQETDAASTILELKFTSLAPRWMSNIVQRFDLLRSSFSKYRAAVQAWYMSPSYGDPYPRTSTVAALKRGMN